MKDRWIKLFKTSPSGKIQWVCQICGRTSTTPDKACDKGCHIVWDDCDGDVDKIPINALKDIDSNRIKPGDSQKIVELKMMGINPDDRSRALRALSDEFGASGKVVAKGLNVVVVPNGEFPDEICLYSMERTTDIDKEIPEITIKIMEGVYKFESRRVYKK